MKDKAAKHRRLKTSDVSRAAMKGKIGDSFAQQVAGFIKRYRPALEALSKR